MAVYTKFSRNNIEEILSNYSIGKLISYKGIQEGIENTNYFLLVDSKKYILTIYEKRVKAEDLPFFSDLMTGLDKDNFYLYGQSWGGILAMEYALKYQDNLKGLVISNMMASIPDYMKYSDEVLAPKLPPEVLAEIMEYENAEDYSNERYMELVVNHYYTRHILRMDPEKWPDPINRGFKHLNPDVYVTMQGPSEFGVKGDATLKAWDVKDQLHKHQKHSLEFCH